MACFHSRLKQTVINLDLVTQCSLFYCTLFMEIFTRSGSKLWVMKDKRVEIHFTSIPWKILKFLSIDYCRLSDVLLHLFFGILFNLMSNKHDAQECCMHHLMPEQKQKLDDKESTLILTGGVFVLVWLLNHLGKYNNVHFSVPSPLWKFTSFRPPYPFKFL